MGEAQIKERAEQAAGRGATELHIVGGLHHKLPFQYYVDVVRWVKEAAPEIHVKAYTAVEFEWFRKIERASLTDILQAADRRRARQPARRRGRDLPPRGPRADLRRQGLDRDLARRPPDGPPARPPLERDDALRPHRAARAPDRPPDPAPRAAGRDRRLPDVHPAGLPPRQLADERDPEALGRDRPEDDGHQPPDARQLPAHQGVLDHARDQDGPGRPGLRGRRPRRHGRPRDDLPRGRRRDPRRR